MALVINGHHVMGVLTEIVTGASQVSILLVSGCVGLGHALAVLADPSESRIRRWRAVGFVAGVIATILVVLVDLVVEGG